MAAWNYWTEDKLSRLTLPLRRERVELFVRELRLRATDVVLDLGSEDGSYLATCYPWPQNIVIADIREAPLRRGVAQFGLKGFILLPTRGRLPITDREFAAVWCNSVIEHVTVERSELSQVSDKDFRRLADEHQREFAREIARIGRYFVQTPYLHFPLEAHSWLPCEQYLAQPLRWRAARWLKHLWIKQWSADSLLYDCRRFREHFPDATRILVERLCLLPKSLIAVRRL